MTFPLNVHLENYFQCPIWYADCPSFVSKLNKYSDPYIKKSKQIKKNVDKQFERQTIVVTEKNIDAVRQNVPDAQLGDQFQLRGKTLVQGK